jgi:hypothetical protein
MSETGVAPDVVISGRIYTPYSVKRFIDAWLDRSPLGDRIRRLKTPFVLLAASAAIGAAALCLTVSKTYDSTVQVRLPMQLGGTARLIDTGDLLRQANVMLASAPGMTLSGDKLSMVVDAQEPVAALTATAQTTDTAQELAQTAADIVVNRDQTMLVDAVSRHKPGADFDAAQIARIESPVTSTHSTPQYDLHWNASHIGLAALWLVVMVGCGVILLSVKLPEGAVLSPLEKLGLGKRGASKKSPLGRERDIPIVGGILLTQDLSGESGSAGMRSVLIDSGRDLWAGMLGDPKELEEGANASFHREILVTRPDSAGVGSRAAALAIGRAMSRRGVSVTIIEADMLADWHERNEFGLPDDIPGMVNLMAGNCALDDCLLEDDEIPGLCAVTLGTDGPRTVREADELLRSEAFLDVLDEIAGQTNVLIIHGPDVANAGPIAVRVHGVLVAASEGDDGERQARLAAGSLFARGAEVIGMIEVSENPVAVPG